jgi:hypothetical protein
MVHIPYRALAADEVQVMFGAIVERLSLAPR